jgi:sortase A
MLLRLGIILMTFALAFTGVVTLVAVHDEPMEQAVAAKKPEAPPEPLVRKYPKVKEVKAVEAQPEPEPQPRPEPPPPEPPPPEPEPRPEPVIQEEEWPMPTEEQVEAASQPRRYNLPRGAVMGLTVEALELYDVPVYDSDAQWALDEGVAHTPETSLPWSPTPQRNVFLAGHRIGWPGTWSHLVFYHLDKLGAGDRILLRDRQGRRYEYEVTETFVTDPTDSWVMGQVRGRDMVTLQTCTPIPTFEKRIIVRADRI